MRSPRQFSLSFALAFFGILTAVYAQEITSYFSPDVKRVGQRLACRCGGCRNTVGDCPMIHCSSSDPKRRQIYEMKQKGLSDDAIVSAIVREEGIVALSSPPPHGLGPIITWIGPGIALLLGFGVYSWYVRHNRKEPAVLLPADQAVLDRFQSQIDRELDDAPLPGGPAKK
jgi:cytochrome c-type biogenesis protein CcmH/NrfF